ncbi:dual specificity protein kinase TTK-like [Ixodes scapularis]|uniref:Serine/threonine protein kinase PLK3, putative n=1 Tax=Ixodes scapularis TaxID=6945 RepID=B7PVZ6_IXOSC|nr:dual specificity protein kinase TTK-like [Ixodes scapularis]EEC10768.1 serine/threonine protein kinase PLK3, putative [Ixodes scapularis]|eukprot:XP_002408896.1 serine/threonine protein kinase PLK3, putative [Ixodes scapularis]
MLAKCPKPKEDKISVIQVNGRTYHTLELVSKRGPSKVFMVLGEHQGLRAVQLISLEGVEPKVTVALLCQVRTLKMLRDCRRVVILYDFEYDHERSLLKLVMEAGVNDLTSVIRSRMKESLNILAVKFYWSEMLQAVLEIHNKGVIPSNLEPARFLFVNGKLKLIGFCIADLMQADTTSVMEESPINSLNFMSPESITRMPGHGTGDWELISTRPYIWSLGCILYSLVYGHALFQHIVARDDKLRAIINSKYTIPFYPLVSPSLLDVLKQCLRRNVRERPTINELLRHPFLAENHGLLKPWRN